MRNKNALRVIFFVALLVLFVGALASSGCGALKIKASVAGHVFMNEKLMPNFTVQLVDTSGQVVQDGKTNQQGHFIITNVPPGKYTVRILTFAGTPHPNTFEITVRPGRTEVADFDLGGEAIPEPKPG